MRSSSSLPSTAATGRRSRIHSNAPGTSVKTSMRTARPRLPVVREAEGDEHLARLQVDLEDALVHEWKETAAVELQRVVGRAGQDVSNEPEPRPALLDHLEAHEVGDVERP